MTAQTPAWIKQAAEAVHDHLFHCEKSGRKTSIANIIASHAAPMLAENKRLREALNAMLGACTRYLEEQVPSESNLYDPDYRSPLSIAREALQGDQPKENA